MKTIFWENLTIIRSKFVSYDKKVVITHDLKGVMDTSRSLVLCIMKYKVLYQRDLNHRPHNPFVRS